MTHSVSVSVSVHVYVIGVHFTSKYAVVYRSYLFLFGVTDYLFRLKSLLDSHETSGAQTACIWFAVAVAAADDAATAAGKNKRLHME